MAEREQINFRLSPERKTQWEKAVEDSNDAESLSHLIRMSVQRELAGDHDDTGPAQTDDLDEVINGIRSIQNTLDDMETRLKYVESVVDRSPDESELGERIFERLPTEKPGSEGWQAHQSQWRPEVYTIWPGTIEAIAETLEAPERRVQRALERLRSDTSLVRTETVDGEQRYWRMG